MKKKDFIFTLGLCLLMGVLWVAGEVVMGLWVAVNTAGHIAFFATVVVVTLVISVWHSMKEDESDLQDPKRAKYERKTKKK
ncbi:MAG: hypothetical protein NC340_07850 [Ruminococcus flavefaciens]|nr:hypothetical protein [Ruminococcus flavefaciens]